MAILQAVASYSQYYLDILESEMESKASVETAAKVARKILYDNKQNINGSMIVAGFNAKNKKPEIYTIPFGGALIEQEFAIAGSGAAYLQGFCDSAFKRDMSKDECEEFVSKAIAHAIARDSSSGCGVRLVVVSEEGTSKKIIGHPDLPFLLENGER
ncbi:Proteasome subunit beta type-6, variant 2 [Bonamia ostreae]